MLAPLDAVIAVHSEPVNHWGGANGRAWPETPHTHTHSAHPTPQARSSGAGAGAGAGTAAPQGTHFNHAAGRRGARTSAGGGSVAPTGIQPGHTAGVLGGGGSPVTFLKHNQSQVLRLLQEKGNTALPLFHNKQAGLTQLLLWCQDAATLERLNFVFVHNAGMVII